MLLRIATKFKVFPVCSEHLSVFPLNKGCNWNKFTENNKCIEIYIQIYCKNGHITDFPTCSESIRVLVQISTTIRILSGRNN